MPSAFGIPVAGGDSQMLDQPPPNPAQPSANGQNLPSSIGGLSGASPVPSGLLPPEILAGAMQVAAKINDELSSLAQVAPDLGADWSQIQTLLQTAMSKLLVAGAQPPSPTATGSQFAGGGMDRGGMAA
jgi:hypothetical protein